MTESDFDISEWVAASRAEQGLPPKIEDPAALARVLALLGRDELSDEERLDEREFSPGVEPLET